MNTGHHGMLRMGGTKRRGNKAGREQQRERAGRQPELPEFEARKLEFSTHWWERTYEASLVRRQESNVSR